MPYTNFTPLDLFSDPKQMREGAVHESGHTVVGLSLGFKLDYVALFDLKPVKPPGIGLPRARTEWNPEEWAAKSSDAQATVIAAGMAGEIRILDCISSQGCAEGDDSFELMRGCGSLICCYIGAALKILDRNFKAHDALATTLFNRLRMQPHTGGRISGDEVWRIFNANEGQLIRLEELLSF